MGGPEKLEKFAHSVGIVGVQYRVRRALCWVYCSAIAILKSLVFK